MVFDIVHWKFTKQHLSRMPSLYILQLATVYLLSGSNCEMWLSLEALGTKRDSSNQQRAISNCGFLGFYFGPNPPCLQYWGIFCWCLDCAAGRLNVGSDPSAASCDSWPMCADHCNQWFAVSITLSDTPILTALAGINAFRVHPRPIVLIAPAINLNCGPDTYPFRMCLGV